MRIILLLILVSPPAFSQTSAVRPYAPELFSNKISGAVCGFANNGKTIFFVREDTIKDKLIIYEAQRKGNKWADTQPLPFSGDYNDMGGRLSHDGSILYFTSDRPGGSNRENDSWNIWKSQRNANSWSAPEPLIQVNNLGSGCCPVPMPDGSIIFSGTNKDQNEWQMLLLSKDQITPLESINNLNSWQWPSSYYEGEKILIFNSMKRPDTMGKDDVYISFQINNSWTEPFNIGEQVNTSIYEDGAILSPDGKHLIFNQHETGATPSQVMFTKWKPILRRLRKEVDKK